MAKSFGSCQPAQTAQADIMNRYFSQMHQTPPPPTAQADIMNRYFSQMHHAPPPPPPPPPVFSETEPMNSLYGVYAVSHKISISYQLSSGTAIVAFLRFLSAIYIFCATFYPSRWLLSKQHQSRNNDQ